MIILPRMQGLAREAGKIALRHYGCVAPELKANKSVVTAADREVEAFLSQHLPSLIRNSGFIGEEMVRNPQILDAARAAEWVWVVDPIDGTAGFLDGLDLFCVSIGLLHDGQPEAGVLFFPVVNHLYSAWRGEGAECDGRPIHVLQEEPIADRRILYVDAYSHLRFNLSFSGKTRSLASTALHLALVARGVAVGAISTGHVWDYAAAAMILEEAGGTFKQMDGGMPDWRAALDGRRFNPPMLGAPAALWDQVAGTIAAR